MRQEDCKSRANMDYVMSSRSACTTKQDPVLKKEKGRRKERKKEGKRKGGNGKKEEGREGGKEGRK
jgi:hypothetical protein